MGKNTGKTKYSGRGGFTLVEVLVAISLFSVIVSIAVGGFVRALRVQRQAAVLLTANSSVSLVLEQISREVRTGTGFSFISPGDPTGLKFKNAKKQDVYYCLDAATQAILRAENSACSGGQAITSGNVKVNTLFFSLSGNTDGDGFPPRVTVRVSVSPKGDSGVSSTTLNLQTTVSARNIDT